MSRPDIVERLRAFGAHDWDDYGDAADEIEKLRKALRDIVGRYPQRKMMLPFIVNAKALLGREHHGE